MAGRTHTYEATIAWTGDKGSGTSGYRAYGREHLASAPGKPDLALSSDPAFRGDPARWNPEELLVASLSSCHMLWFLHLATEAGIAVRSYRDHATGRMAENPDGSGQFEDLVLRPIVAIDKGDPSALAELHHRAHQMCFIARSVNFSVRCEPSIERLETAQV